MEAWYTELDRLKRYLVQMDPKLEIVFTQVDASGFKLHTIIKDPFPALIGAIIGQKVRYIQAKKERSKLYSMIGTQFTPEDVIAIDCSWLGVRGDIIKRVTEHIITHQLSLKTELEIRSLIAVSGIGEWTISTTLLTCLLSLDVYPPGDKFILARIRKLYGPNLRVDEIVHNWAPYRSIVTWYLWRWF